MSVVAGETFTTAYYSKDGFNRTITNVSDSVIFSVTPYQNLSKTLGSILPAGSGSAQTAIVSGDPGYYNFSVKLLNDNTISGDTYIYLNGSVFNIGTTGKASGSAYDTYTNWNLVFSCTATSGLDSGFWILDSTAITAGKNILFQNSANTTYTTTFSLSSDSWNALSDSVTQHYIVFYVYNDSGELKTLTYNFYKGASKPFVSLIDDSYVFYSYAADMGSLINIDFYDTTAKLTDAWITNSAGADTQYIFSNASYPNYTTNWQFPSAFSLATGNNSIKVFCKNENGQLSDEKKFNVFYDYINISSGNVSEFNDSVLLESSSDGLHKLYFCWDAAYLYFGI